ncbi:MAG: glycosyltransferase family 2 protein [Paracoccaceae bacterium]
MRALIVLCLRNEGAFLLEWLAHHRACGFTDFLVYSNDCQDGTDAMLDRLEAMGWLTHLRNDGPHDEGPQWAALKAADQHPRLAGADWVLVADIDEFVNIHVGDRTLTALFAAMPQAAAIPLTWRMFGNGGHVRIADAPVTETFTRAAPPVLWWPWRALHFKTLFRNDGSYRKLGVHRPRNATPGAAPVWIDGSGDPLPQGFSRLFSDLGRDSNRLVQLNHYALGSMENYIVKCDRGRANREASAFDLGYWVERNFAAVEDRSILSLDSRAIREALHSDPVLGPLHRAAVDWRRSRFRSLMEHENWRALFGRLLLTPPTRVLDRASAQLVAQYAWPSAKVKN